MNAREISSGIPSGALCPLRFPHAFLGIPPEIFKGIYPEFESGNPSKYLPQKLL